MELCPGFRYFWVKPLNQHQQDAVPIFGGSGDTPDRVPVIISLVLHSQQRAFYYKQQDEWTDYR